MKFNFEFRTVFKCTFSHFNIFLYFLGSYLTDGCGAADGAALTWAVGLQVPGPAAAARLDGAGQGGVDGAAGLHVALLVPGGGNLQDGDGGALPQPSRQGQHFCEAVLARADGRLQGAAQNHRESDAGL